MKRWIASVTGLVLLVPQLSRADFKYSETTQFTGGAAAGLLKFASKVGGKNTGPEITTYYLKGNRMRIEDADGEIQIIDLDARHIIHIKTRNKSYGVITFAEMQAQIGQMRKLRAKSGQKGQATATPVVRVTPTQNTKDILGQNSREIQATVELRISETAGAKVGSTTTIDFDSWVASGVRGYAEVQEFYKRLSRELAWAPGNGLAADPRLSQAMEEMKKNSPILSGFPLLSSMKMSGGRAGANRSEDQANPSADDIPTTVPTSKGDAVTEALGGLLSLHKRKKSTHQDSSVGEPGETALLSVTTEVRSFSNSTLDAVLFEVPSGYRQEQEK